MSTPYVYLEYPKCLYRGDETCTVHSEEADVEATNDGWLTAGQFHGTEPKPVDEPDKKPAKKGK